MKTTEKKWMKHLIRGAVIIAVLVLLYLVAVFSSIPFIAKWRTLYIETAMSTHSHQWLATAFIPKNVVDEVVSHREEQLAQQEILSSNWDGNDTSGTEAATANEDDESAAGFFHTYWELDTPSVRSYISTDFHVQQGDYSQLKVVDLDGTLGLKSSEGDDVLVIDVPNKLLIIGVEGDGYVGKLAIAKDPAQIALGKSSRLGSRGDIIDTYGTNYNAVVAINASGFTDVKGHGSGGDVRGSMIIDGVEYGDHSKAKGHWKFIGMQYDDRMYITNYDVYRAQNYRWAVEFGPALIVDGVREIDNSFGLGIQPRTAIGQQKDGAFLMLIIDGRQAGYSLGCTVNECGQILERYKAYQAANLDGGSSAIMLYDGKQITKSSSPSGFGRYLPNALMVIRNED